MRFSFITRYLKVTESVIKLYPLIQCLNWDYIIIIIIAIAFVKALDCMPEIVCISVGANYILWKALILSGTTVTRQIA